MAMTETEGSDFDGLAAEYVLGTLDAAERSRAEALLRTDTAFAAAVNSWERRLEPLLDVAPVRPPSDILDEVFAALSRSEAPSPQIIELRRRATAWKWTAAAAGALAASLALYVGFRPSPPATSPYFAILESPDRKEAFVAASSPSGDGLVIRRVTGPPPPGRSYELWAIKPGAAPQSLGVTGTVTLVPSASLARKTGGEPLENILLAITEEAAGGSPDGKPGGQPLFTGKLTLSPSS
jgi:anti-sigma-K factor RskA